MKNYLPLLGFCCLLPFTFSPAKAETCPSIQMLHNHNLGNWQAFDIDNGTPVAGNQLITFEDQANLFWQAAYYPDAPEGAAQCYYFGTGKNNYLNAYLAQPHLKPKPNTAAWLNGFACFENIEACGFVYE